MIYIDFAVSDINRVPSGKTSSGTALRLEIVIQDLDENWTEISLLEPIGTGQPLDNPAPKQGQGRSRSPASGARFSVRTDPAGRRLR